MADDNACALLPLACRFVPADLWLTTHVEYSWTVQELKHWLLTKYNIVTHDPAHTDSSSAPRFRPSSPVAFARASTDGSGSDSEDADTPAGRDQRIHRANMATNSHVARDDIGFQYCLMSYSNGHILEDHHKLSAYNIHPHELIELQRRNDSIFISRPNYVQPYFEMALQVLKSGSREDRNLDDTNSQHTTATTESRGAARPRNRRVGQWKERRLVIKDGRISIWRERHDKQPMSTFSLANLVALYPPEHVGLLLACACLDASRCSCCDEGGRTTHAICVRFTGSPAVRNSRRPERERLRFVAGSDIESRRHLGVHSPTSSMPERKYSVRSRSRAQTDSTRTLDSGSDTEYVVKDDLLVLRLPDERSFYNLLRILHYSETTIPLASAFVTAKPSPASPTAQSTPASEPPSALLSSEPTTATTTLTSPSEASPFPSIKLRKGSTRPTILPSDRPSDESTTHRTLRYESDSHPSLAIAVRYPAWRQHILRRATHAGRASYALLQGREDPNAQTDSENEWDGWAFDFQGRLARRLVEEPHHTPRVIRGPESAPAAKLMMEAPTSRKLRPSRIRSAESLRTQGTMTPTPSIVHAPAVEELRAEGVVTKKRKLSISIFIPGTPVASTVAPPAVVKPPGRSRSASAAAMLPLGVQQIAHEPRRKASAGNLGFGFNLRLSARASGLLRRPSTTTIGRPNGHDSERDLEQTTSRLSETATIDELSQDGVLVASPTSSSPLARVNVALRKVTARRSVDTAHTTSTSSGTGTGSRAGSSLGHTCSQSTSGDTELTGEPGVGTSLPVLEVSRASSPSRSVPIPTAGLGRLVRGLSFRK